jgi:RNA polymerase sigma-70 factor (ECF subfamily)
MTGAATIPSAATQTENNDLSEHIRRMIQELPEKHRLVMHLRDIEEMTYEEISTVLSMPADQVKTNLHRARKTIRARLIQELKISYP